MLQFVRPLRRAARARLADPTERKEWACRATPVAYTREELRSLRALFAEMPDCRRGQGMKHKLATVLSVCALARLAGVSGPAATERFARYLSQEELRALGAWRDPVPGRWVAPSDSTLCRVMADTDPDALQDVLRRWAAPRTVASGPTPALAADAKRIRGANRHTGEGGVLRDRHPRHPRGAPAREPLLPQRGRGTRRDPGVARRRRRARVPGHPRCAAHEP